MGIQIPTWEGAILRGEGAAHSKVQGHSAIICAPIKMPFGLWARMGRKNRVRCGSRGAEGRCHGNQFWD